MRKAEILNAQEDRRYGKDNHGSGLPDELRRRHERIRQARKEIEADAPAAEQAELNKRAEAAETKAKAARETATHNQRRAIVEPVNGQIKEARGLRRFLLRGLEKVDVEWPLITAKHNLLKLFR